jgi:hypothetical protein
MKYSSFKHNGSETKILPQALRCEVLGCYSRGGLPRLFPLLGFIIGPHSTTTAVTKP